MILQNKFAQKMSLCSFDYCKFVAFNKGILINSLPKIYLTMREIISILFLFIIFSFTAQAQDAEIFAFGGSVDQYDTLDVDIKAYKLTDLYGLGYRHQFDTTKFEYVGLVNLHPELASLSSFKVQDDDFIRVTWNSSGSSGADFQDTSLMYTLRFVAIGPKGSKDTLKFTKGQEFVVLNGNGDDIPRTFHDGVMRINGETNTAKDVLLTLTSAAGSQNDEVCIDLSVENFDSITNFQFAVTWDKSVATYSQVKNITSAIPGFGSGKFNYFNNDHLRVIWDHPTSGNTTLNGKTQMATLCFTLTGSPGASTFVRVDSITVTPKFEIEFYNPDGPLKYQLTPGKLRIRSGGGGSKNLTFAVGKTSVKMGEKGCVPITVKNYKKIFGFQFPILYDKSLLSNPTVENLLPEFDSTAGFDYNIVNPGEVFILFVDSDVRSLSDNTKLFDVCFDAVGACDTKPSVSIKETEREVQAYDENNDIIIPDVVDGSITITCDGGGGGSDSLTVIAGSKTVKKGEEVCVPFTVQNFTDIASLQYVMHWDASVLKLKSSNYVRAFNLPRLGPGNFNPENGTNDYLIFASWTPNDPVTVADNTKIFEVCFDAVGDCDASTAISIVEHGKVSIEALNGNDDEIPVATRKGKVTVNCPNTDITVTIDEVTLPTCHGECDGQIKVVTKPVDSYSYQWFKNGQPIPRSEGGTSSLLRNVCAGEYFVSIKKNATGATDSSQTVVINDPPAIDLHKVVTPDMGNCEGKVQVSPTGGYKRYELLWQNTGVSGPVIDNLCKDSMVVLIFKDTVPMLKWNGTNFDTVPSLNKRICFFLDTTKIPMKMNSDLAVTGTVKNATCAGTCDGSITLTVTGSSGTISYLWIGQGITDNTQKDQSGLCAGKYSVEVKDGTGATVTKMFMITQPDSIKITSVRIDSAMGNDGQIIVDVTGGTPPYTYEWKDANGNTVSTSKNLSGVPKGKYTLIVTDDNGCTGTAMFVVPMKNGNGGNQGDLTITTSKYNGDYGIPCNGDSEGWIKVHGAPGNAKFTWSHDAALTDSTATNLSAGTYKVKVESSQGKVLLDTTIILTEPTALKAQITSIQCASADGTADGQYSVTPKGGTAPYTYQWCDNSTDSIATDLPGGVNCNLIVTDANSCEYIVNFKVCVVSDTSDPVDCYQGRKVITPNNDNLNDYLLITCDNKYDNKLFVYDRWGRLVYEKVNYQSSAGDGWRGVDLNGNDLNEGGYMWVLRVDLPNGDQRYYKGTVILAR